MKDMLTVNKCISSHNNQRWFFCKYIILLKALEHTAIMRPMKYLFAKRKQIENIPMTQKADKNIPSWRSLISSPGSFYGFQHWLQEAIGHLGSTSSRFSALSPWARVKPRVNFLSARKQAEFPDTVTFRSTFLQRQQMSSKLDVKKEDQTDKPFYCSVWQSKFTLKKYIHT